MPATILSSRESSLPTRRLSLSSTWLSTDFMQSLPLESATEKTPGLVGRLAPRLHAKAFTGGLIVLTFIVVGILGPALAPYNPTKQDLPAFAQPPEGIAR